MLYTKEEVTKIMQKELEAYIANNSTAKPLAQSMKEISAWLRQKEQS